MTHIHVYSDAVRNQLSNQLEVYRAKYQIRWDALIHALTFKQYRRLPVLCQTHVERILAVHTVTKSAKLRAFADETCVAWLEYNSAREAFKQYLALDQSNQGAA